MPSNSPRTGDHDLAATCRRDFLSACSLLLGACGALIVAIPGVGFLFEPLFRGAQGVWRKVGAVDSFEIGKTVEVAFEDASPLAWSGVTARTGAWLRRDGPDEATAFSVNCAHLGCPVRWLPDANLFMCPCHGGVYDQEGRVAAGPPPHGLARYPVRIVDGQVEVQTSPLPVG